MGEDGARGEGGEELLNPPEEGSGSAPGCQAQYPPGSSGVGVRLPSRKYVAGRAKWLEKNLWLLACSGTFQNAASTSAESR